MPVCPVCRRSFDGRFQVFVPPHYDAFDSVACARRASQARGPAQREPLPVILPPIEVRTPLRAKGGSRLRRLGLVASALSLSPAPAAVAAGISLVAAGTTASVYLWRTSGGAGTPAASGHPTGTTIAHRPALSGPQGGAGSSATPPAAAEPRSSHPATGKKPLRSRPAKHAAKNGATAAGAEQHGPISGPRRLRWRSSGQTIRASSEAASAGHASSSLHRAATAPAKRPAPHLPRAKPPAQPGTPPPSPPAPNVPGGGATPTGSPPQEPQPQTPRRSKPTPPQTTHSSAPATPPTAQTALPQRPGNGWGDKNHHHTGSGQSTGSSSGPGNGQDDDDHDD